MTNETYIQRRDELVRRQPPFVVVNQNELTPEPGGFLRYGAALLPLTAEAQAAYDRFIGLTNVQKKRVSASYGGEGVDLFRRELAQTGRGGRPGRVALVAAGAERVVTAVTPGPNTLMSMSNGGRLGFRRALPFNFGIWAGFTVVMLLCTALCGALSALIPRIRLPMLVLGAAYMLHLAWKTWRSGPLSGGQSGGDGFWSGLLLQFINPKIYIYGIVSMEACILPLLPGADAAAGGLCRAAGLHRLRLHPAVVRLRLPVPAAVLPLRQGHQHGDGPGPGVVRRLPVPVKRAPPGFGKTAKNRHGSRAMPVPVFCRGPALSPAPPSVRQRFPHSSAGPGGSCPSAPPGSSPAARPRCGSRPGSSRRRTSCP